MDDHKREQIITDTGLSLNKYASNANFKVSRNGDILYALIRLVGLKTKLNIVLIKIDHS